MCNCIRLKNWAHEKRDRKKKRKKKKIRQKKTRHGYLLQECAGIAFLKRIRIFIYTVEIGNNKLKLNKAIERRYEFAQ